MTKETEKAAICAGVKPMEYKMLSHFLPVPTEKYYCFSGNYQLAGDLFQILKESGLNTVELNGAFTTRQEAFLIDNAEGVIAQDDWRITYAESIKKPFVAFENEQPEEIANKLLRQLNLPETRHKTILIGENYGEETIDFVPDFPVNNPFILPVSTKVFIRLDLCYNLEFARMALQRRPAAIMSNVPVPREFLEQNKSKIGLFVYLLDENNNKDFVLTLHKSGIKYALISTLPQRLYSELCFKYFDFNPVLQLSNKSINIPEGGKFKTSRVLLSQGKYYASEYHWERFETLKDEEDVTYEMLRDPKFIKTEGSYYFYSK